MRGGDPARAGRLRVRRAHGAPGVVAKEWAPVGARQVELVDESGAALGACDVDGAHRLPPRLHRAFSVVLHDGAGRALFQRRSTDKERWPGALANSCCGHPRSVGTVLADAAARVGEELGVAVGGLAQVGVFTYQATDPGGVWAEWEYDHVLVGRLDPATALRPDPAEVSESLWLTPGQWRARGDLAPWVARVMELAAPHL